MSDSEKPLREQIDEAMATIAHQLELLREGPTIGGPLDERDVIAGLDEAGRVRRVDQDLTLIDIQLQILRLPGGTPLRMQVRQQLAQGFGRAGCQCFLQWSW